MALGFFLKIKYEESSIKILIIFGMLSILALLIASQLARAGELPKIGEVAPNFNLPRPEWKVFYVGGFSRSVVSAVFLPKG